MDSRNALRDPLASVRAHLAPALLTAIAGLGILFMTQRIPALLLLPGVSLAALAVAGAVALYAVLRRPEIRADAVNAWDISGACALIGFAAGMASDHDQALALFGFAVTPL